MSSSLARPGKLLLAIAAVGAAYALSPKQNRIQSGQVAIITGGSSGLGLALAHELGKRGVKLVLAARSKERLRKACRELLLAGHVQAEDLLDIPCDVSDQHQAAALIAATVAYFGKVDILVNDAGVIHVGPAEDESIGVYRAAMDTNFFGALHTTYAALPHLLKNQQSSIINISSIGGKIAVPHMLPYVASKFALTGFSEGLHTELRQKGVRVTTVCPGLLRTGGEEHAHFAGKILREKLWFQMSAKTPILSANVRSAATKIIAAANTGRAEITITPQAWLAARFIGVAPETSQKFASLVCRWLLPNPPKLWS